MMTNDRVSEVMRNEGVGFVEAVKRVAAERGFVPKPLKSAEVIDYEGHKAKRIS